MAMVYMKQPQPCLHKSHGLDVWNSKELEVDSVRKCLLARETALALHKDADFRFYVCAARSGSLVFVTEYPLTYQRVGMFVYMNSR